MTLSINTKPKQSQEKASRNGQINKNSSHNSVMLKSQEQKESPKMVDPNTSIARKVIANLNLRTTEKSSKKLFKSSFKSQKNPPKV